MRQQRTEVYRRRKDLIGALPDGVLHHVLSFLPAQEAVQTCVLARRWRHLWRSVPSLRVVCPEDNPWFGTLDEQGVRRLNRFMENLLVLRDHRVPLEFCEFKIIDLDEIDEKGPNINLWVRRAISFCRAWVLEVKVYMARNYVTIDGVQIFSDHLRRLVLSGLVLEGDILDFSSSPALENLWMKDCCICAENISSGSLKRLTIICCNFSVSGRFRISVPSLVRLELSDNKGKAPVLENMPLLVNAFVRLHNCSDNCRKEKFGGPCMNASCKKCIVNGDGNRVSVILKGLSMAKSLELVAETGQFIFKRDLVWCPTFIMLKTLFLNEWCVEIDFHPLICFLQHTPVLEELTLQLLKAPKNWVEKKGVYSPSKQPFASKKLKVVKVKCDAFDKRVRGVFRILSTYGKYLEQINFELTENWSECYSFQTNADVSW